MQGVSKSGTEICVLCLKQWLGVGVTLGMIPRYKLREMKNGFITQIEGNNDNS